MGASDQPRDKDGKFASAGGAGGLAAWSGRAPAGPSKQNEPWEKGTYPRAKGTSAELHSAAIKASQEAEKIPTPDPAKGYDANSKAIQAHYAAENAHRDAGNKERAEYHHEKAASLYRRVSAAAEKKY